MDTNVEKWISRRATDNIWTSILTNDKSKIIYLVHGKGGSGKTYVARDIGTRLGSKTGYEPSAEYGKPKWSGILDLYDSAVSNEAGLERSLSRAFGADNHRFASYEAATRTLRDRMSAGVQGSDIDRLIDNVSDRFAEAMTSVAEESRLIICLDTVERLTPIPQLSQHDVGGVMAWLKAQLPKWQNYVLLCFGRPSERLFSEIEKTVVETNAQNLDFPIRTERVDLDHLGTDEIDEFYSLRLTQFPQVAQSLSDAVRSKIVEQSGANPLLIDLAIMTLVRSPSLNLVMKAIDNDDSDQMSRYLLEAFYIATANVQQAILLDLLAVARRGLHRQILETLEPHRCDELWNQLLEMRELPFIKVRSLAELQAKEKHDQQEVFFLHDEMYLLCDRYRFAIPSDVQELTRRILEWYKEEEAAELNKQEADTDRVNRFRVNSLYYRLRTNPVEGYDWYLRTVGQAIGDAQFEFESLLTNELSSFIQSALPIDRNEDPTQTGSPIDSAIVRAYAPCLPEWIAADSQTLQIKRLTARGKREEALHVGLQASDTYAANKNSSDKRLRLSWAELRVYFGQALMYSGEISRAESMYGEVIKLVANSDVGPTHFEEYDRSDLWRVDLVMGRAHNNLGYLFWIYRGMYDAALNELHKATRYFRASDEREEVANTSDNKGRIYSVMGEEERAAELVDDGLEIRKDINLPYRVALSHNSMAIVNLQAGHLEVGLEQARKAWTLMRQINVQRGLGLVYITLGRAYRAFAETWRNPLRSYDVDHIESWCTEAEVNLREAIDCFGTGRVHEPIKLIDAYNERGCAYRARCEFEIHRDLKRRAARSFDQAKIDLEQAVQLAENEENPLLKADSLQDIAELYVAMDEYATAEEWLVKAENQIDTSYKIGVGGLLPLNKLTRVNEYYNLLGKIELLRGNVAMAKRPVSRDAVVQATKHYVFAAVYFTEFSPRARALGTTYRDMYRKYKTSKRELLPVIKQDVIPDLQKSYGIPADTLSSFLSDVLGAFD